ncbi:hypothetical protein NPIL_597911 [Nephila pilipes]|uniref:Uncharacterized protein n=1 Tax=Nephila pilipes TaxID=299642 RepID=A0A8X6TYX9_NEPPI|nr:hypothetical protein NPIL_597911 [Nephila pilipes]
MLICQADIELQPANPCNSDLSCECELVTEPLRKPISSSINGTSPDYGLHLPVWCSLYELRRPKASYIGHKKHFTTSEVTFIEKMPTAGTWHPLVLCGLENSEKIRNTMETVHSQAHHKDGEHKEAHVLADLPDQLLGAPRYLKNPSAKIAPPMTNFKDKYTNH